MIKEKDLIFKKIRAMNETINDGVTNQKEDQKQKTKETVLYGSFYEALYANFIKIEDVLEYLLNNKPENEFQRKRMCINYRIVCNFTKEQYINGEHFISLTDNEDYICIYCLSFPRLTIENVDHKTNFQISKKVQNIIVKFIKQPEYCRFFYVLCDFTGSDFVFKEEEYLFISCVRSLKNIHKTVNDVFAILASDYLSILDLNETKKYIHDLIERCIYLKVQAPLYWEKVAFPLYNDYVKNKMSDAKGFNKETIQLYSGVFPDLFGDEIKNMRTSSLILQNLSNELCAYYLGYPVHKYIPNKNILENSIQSLNKLGIDKYCENLKKDVTVSTNISTNAENVETDKIDEFNKFDVISYYDNTGHLFRFTRCEFPNLLKDEKNFYTQEVLPYSIIEKIKTRLRIAAKYNLPPSKTLKELLYNLEKGDEDENHLDEDDLDEDEDESELITVEIDDLDEDSDSDNEFSRYIIGKVRDIQTGVEKYVRFPIPDEIDESEMEEYVEELLYERGIEYLGRQTCTCPSCGINEVD